MKTNLVIFEMNPEQLNVYRVPETVMTPDELLSIAGVAFNCDDASEEQWATFNELSEALTDEEMEANGVKFLEFPLSPLPGELVYHVFCAM